MRAAGIFGLLGSALVGLSLVGWAGPAFAADPPPPPPPAPAGDPASAAPEATTHEFPSLVRPSLVHTMQFGIALLPGTGYRGIFPYQENIDCGSGADKRVCTGRLPFFLDAQLSFGFARSWDILVDLRFGIEQDFTRSHQLAIAPGFRYWVDAELHTKFFATIQGVIDTTDQNNPVIKNNDFAVRNANGVMYEIMRNLGIYLQFGETIGLRRWLRFEIDGGVGVQARFP